MHMLRIMTFAQKGDGSVFVVGFRLDVIRIVSLRDYQIVMDRGKEITDH